MVFNVAIDKVVKTWKTGEHSTTVEFPVNVTVFAGY